VTALAEIVPDTPVTAVGVVVPAHNEHELIAACLTSVRRALTALPAEVESAVAVVLDRCTDTTPERVAALLADWPQAFAIRVEADAGRAPRVTRASGPPARPNRPHGPGVGALRDLGLRSALDRLAVHPVASVWLLSTDADTSVPADWALAHLRCAAEGAHAVAGLAELVGVGQLTAAALRRYRGIVERGLHGHTHRHVYGANLGVRADAYLAVGGFPPDGVGEDHGLWRRLRAAGYSLAQPVEISVRTSARLHGRVDDGLAGLLRSLHRPDRHKSPHCGGRGCGGA
jgi:glycosyltransferase involved in cell wall biosynthesis